MHSVQPVLPPAPYIGGKKHLAKTIVSVLEKIPHRLYAEPFVGMGGVFLRRRSAPPVEVINDYSRDVATFFRVLQRHYVPFVEMLRFQLTGRAEFERLMATEPSTLTDLERAARFLYLQRTAFGGKVAGRTFGVAPDRPARFDITRLGPILQEVHERLAGIVIECLPYGEFLARYDRAGALFYLDPPYFKSEEDYGKGVFGREDFARLAELLGSLKGTFLLSINDTPEIRRVFRAFRSRTERVTYTVAARHGKGTAAGELLVTNWKGRW